jgi:hypothetical protein
MNYVCTFIDMRITQCLHRGDRRQDTLRAFIDMRITQCLHKGDRRQDTLLMGKASAA